MNRTEVFNVINGERDYQESLNKGMNHKGNPTIEAELLMMEEYLREARSKWVHTHGNDLPCLDMMRKVVGMGVRCFENHGVPERQTSK
jgi:hypothetical protein